MNQSRKAMLGAALLITAATQSVAEPVEGRVQWLQRVELSTLVSGVVKQVTVAPGDRIQKGELLVQLEQGALRAEVDGAEAELAYQRAARDEAERELERTRELYDRTLLSDHDLELAKIAFARTEAAHRGAQAQLADARERLRYSAVRAPFNGVVLSRSVEPGQTVVTRLQSVPLVTMAATERLLARIEVRAEQLSALDGVTELDVLFGGRRYRGELYRFGLEPVTADSDRYAVDVAFSPEPGQTHRIGQPITVELP